jgi:phosphoribosyl-ATP pyrophosphohydrolase/phosphoribosyl-AMP cyclohydrolase
MNIDFSKKHDGLIPAIIQDSETKTVLMLGYMNAEAYQKTVDSQKVTFIVAAKKKALTKREVETF